MESLLCPDDTMHTQSARPCAGTETTTSAGGSPQHPEHVIDTDRAGSRLDALVRDLAGLSLRAGRRLVEDGCVLVNGLRKKPGYRALAGDRICLVSGQAPMNCSNDASAPCAPRGRLLKRTDAYAWFFKPALLHTVRLSGRSNASLEAQIPQLLEDPNCADLQLLQRLDYATSGIVTAALNQESALRFREEEALGHVVKKYVCLVCGTLGETVIVRNRLVAEGRSRMRALAQEDSDPARWTTLVPLLCGRAEEILGETEDSRSWSDAWAGQELTLAGCLLHRGARHQIRVHAASTGHPLLWDSLYGTAREGAHFFLHHGRLIHGGSDILLLPDWPLGAKAWRLMQNWFALA